MQQSDKAVCSARHEDMQEDRPIDRLRTEFNSVHLHYRGITVAFFPLPRYYRKVCPRCRSITVVPITVQLETVKQHRLNTTTQLYQYTWTYGHRVTTWQSIPHLRGRTIIIDTWNLLSCCYTVSVNCRGKQQIHIVESKQCRHNTTKQISYPGTLKYWITESLM